MAIIYNIEPSFDRKLDYNRLYWKMYIENELIVSKMRECISNSKEIQTSIHILEVK